MQAPLYQAYAIGDFSPWAKQVLNEWQSDNLVRLTYNPNIESFCSTAVTSEKSALVVLENSPKSRKDIVQVRGSEQNVLILWVGKSFTKEDLAFALEQRVYAILENPSLSEREVQKSLFRADGARAKRDQLRHLFQSLKSILLQTEPDEKSKSLVAEIKAAIGRIEKLSQSNEFFQLETRKEGNETSLLPLHKSQGLGDALLTISELERTGTLWIRGSQTDQEGKIDFIQGKITVAETGAVSQLKAIYRMFLWDGVRFLFNRKNPEDTETTEIINLEMKALVTEGEQQRARFQMIKKELPPIHLKLDIEPRSLTTSLALSPIDFSTLTQVVDFNFVSDILDYSKNWDVDLFEGLIRLRKTGVIKILSSSAQAV